MIKSLILILFLQLFHSSVFANTQMALMQALLSTTASPSLSYSTISQSIFNGACSGIVTVQTPVNVSGNLTVSLSGVSGLTFFSDSTCTSPISSVVIINGTKQASFYFIASTPGTHSLVSSAMGYLNGVQNQTISTNLYVWTGAGADTNWNTPANWSGGTIPGASHVATFNSICSTNCSPTLNVDVNIKGIRIESGYIGSINQASALITIGSAGFTMNGGIFNGGVGDIYINSSPLFVNGGIFTSTQGTLKFTHVLGGYSQHDLFIVSSINSFIHNNGLVWFHIRSNNYPTFLVKVASGNNFNNIRLFRSGSFTDDAILSSASSPTRPIVMGFASLESAVIKGPWELRGNLSFGAEYGSYVGAEDSQLYFTGENNQTIDNSVGVEVPRGFVTINKAVGSKISLLSNWHLRTGQSLALQNGNLDVGSFNLKIPGTFSLSAGTGAYLNSGTITVGAANTSLSAGAYGSGMIFSGVAP